MKYLEHKINHQVAQIFEIETGLETILETGDSQDRNRGASRSSNGYE